MSFSFDLDTDRRTAYFTAQGCCDYVDFCVALNGLLNHPLYQPGLSIVWDWRRCEILLANTQICSLVETMTRNTTDEQAHRVAIVTSISTHAPAATFQKYIEGMAPNCRVMLFNSMDPATVWASGAAYSDFTDQDKPNLTPPPGAKAFFKTPVQRHGNWTSFVAALSSALGLLVPACPL
ncbi:MAG: hypothetical protein K0Q55_603 [Verrucomicrobia bacterium]|jgi:hypothetical protein|nr:hypothetical protein [Verrucomicrobiota bacterium]